MKRTHRTREDHGDTPDWMLQKKCPHKAKYLAGRRILPKGISGKEKLIKVMSIDLKVTGPGAHLKQNIISTDF